jgi:hypothetical protein
MTSPIFGARIPDDLRSRAEAHMVERGRSKTDLLIAALGQYLDGLNGQASAGVGSSPALERRLAEMEERLGAMEEMLLEEYVPEPQPRYVRRLRPVNSRA